MKVHKGRYKLTWMAKLKMWRKRHGGKSIYFSSRGLGKVKSYPLAYEEWLRKRKELQREEAPPELQPYSILEDRIADRLAGLEGLDTVENRDKWLRLFGLLQAVKRAELNGIACLFDKEEAGSISLDGLLRIGLGAGDPEETYLQSPPPWETERPKPDTTIAGNVADFLKVKRADADRGKIGLCHYDRFRYALEDFTAAVGSKPLTSLSSDVLKEYHQSLEDQIDGGMSASYAKNFLASVTQYVRWLYAMERIAALPRILESKSNGLTIRIPEQAIATFAKEEIATLLRESDDDMRLYILLMCNCGFTQIDVARLKRSEVDLSESGTITRKRSKTKDHENVPVITFPLWAKTAALLRDQIQTSGDLALLNSHGNPLLTEKITDKGKLSRTDNIGLRYRRLRKRLKENGVTIKGKLKALRSTGASTLGEHPDYGRYAQHYLGHSPQTIADRHYVRPAEEQFTKAIEWLGRELGVVPAAS